MTLQPHRAVVAVHDAAKVVIDHRDEASSGSFWRRWFDNPQERHFADEVRAFVMSLDFLLDVPPQVLTRDDLLAIGEDVDRVVKRVEVAIEDRATSGNDGPAALAPAIYVIRARYEELYKRGATKNAPS